MLAVSATPLLLRLRLLLGAHHIDDTTDYRRLHMSDLEASSLELGVWPPERD